MRPILLVSIVGVVTNCYKIESDSITKPSISGHQDAHKIFGVSRRRHHFSGTAKTLTRDRWSSQVRKQGTNQRLEEIAVISKDDEQILDKSISKICSMAYIKRNLYQNKTLFMRRQVEQTFDKVVTGDRVKRQVLKDNRYPNTTWQNGVFYTFNTSG
uniref:Astacin domain-containing protein n=1 Tax=Angiostrongylus cantonensis TaxID=6313 RepID=A0A0K0DCK2_ANGCA